MGFDTHEYMYIPQLYTTIIDIYIERESINKYVYMYLQARGMLTINVVASEFRDWEIHSVIFHSSAYILLEYVCINAHGYVCTNVYAYVQVLTYRS